jgi:hypothetical protein
MAKAILLAAIGLVGGYGAIFGWMVYTSPLSYAEMDINTQSKALRFLSLK